MTELRPPDRVAYDWLLCERVTISMEEWDGEFTTEIWYDAQPLGADEDHGPERGQAEARIAALLGGVWKEYFDEAVVAEIEECIAGEAEARSLEEPDE